MAFFLPLISPSPSLIDQCILPQRNVSPSNEMDRQAMGMSTRSSHIVTCLEDMHIIAEGTYYVDDDPPITHPHFLLCTRDHPCAWSLAHALPCTILSLNVKGGCGLTLIRGQIRTLGSCINITSLHVDKGQRSADHPSTMSSLERILIFLGKSDPQRHHNSIPTKTIDTVVGYLRRIDDAPKERSKLSTELRYLEIYLPPIKDLVDYSRDNIPWLATLQRSHHRFKKISAIVDRLKDRLLDAVVRWPSKRRWPFTKEDVADYLCRIARFKTFILGAMRHDNMVLLQVMQETLGPMNGHAERIAEDRYVTEHLPKVVAERITSGWIASQATNPDIIESSTSRASGTQSTPTSKYPLVYGDFYPHRYR
ncbi:hypothetical protein F5146DRAFT_1169094 [Armillaria mellea]|nr:hypothetical protein F5146DRAFT_1169094 [Armillaria mellea]